MLRTPTGAAPPRGITLPDSDRLSGTTQSQPQTPPSDLKTRTTCAGREQNAGRRRPPDHIGRSSEGARNQRRRTAPAANTSAGAVPARWPSDRVQRGPTKPPSAPTPAPARGAPEGQADGRGDPFGSVRRAKGGPEGGPPAHSGMAPRPQDTWQRPAAVPVAYQPPQRYGPTRRDLQRRAGLLWGNWTPSLRTRGDGVRLAGQSPDGPTFP